MGKYSGVVWICLPEQEKACTFAHPSDLFWDSEKLGAVLESPINGITLARALQEFNEYFQSFFTSCNEPLEVACFFYSVTRIFKNH